MGEGTGGHLGVGGHCSSPARLLVFLPAVSVRPSVCSPLTPPCLCVSAFYFLGGKMLVRERMVKDGKGGAGERERERKKEMEEVREAEERKGRGR